MFTILDGYIINLWENYCQVKQKTTEKKDYSERLQPRQAANPPQYDSSQNCSIMYHTIK